MNITNSNSNNGINEGYSTIKFDNSILSTELLNLKKEFNKLKNENKIICEKNNKFDKEKKEILDKLKIIKFFFYLKDALFYGFYLYY
jgi:hypothetical protein